MVVTKDPLTAANVIYHAVGILETEQETIIATRNAVVVQTNVSQTTSRDRTSTTSRVIRQPRQEDDSEENRDNDGRCHDPLAQTFLIEEEDGCFITARCFLPTKR